MVPMADFDDITGWRDELETFEKTEEGRAFFAGNKRYRGRKMPYENVVQISAATTHRKYQPLLQNLNRWRHCQRVWSSMVALA